MAFGDVGPDKEMVERLAFLEAENTKLREGLHRLRRNIISTQVASGHSSGRVDTLLGQARVSLDALLAPKEKPHE